MPYHNGEPAKLPKSLNLDIQAMLGEKIKTAFPSPPPLPPEGLAALDGIPVGRLKPIGYISHLHRRVNDDVSVVDGNVLYGIRDDEPLCQLHIKMAMSMQQDKLAALPDDDSFLLDPANLYHSTAHSLRYHEDDPYRAVEDNLIIDSRRFPASTPSFPRGDVHARLYIRDAGVTRLKKEAFGPKDFFVSQKDGEYVKALPPGAVAHVTQSNVTPFGKMIFTQKDAQKELFKKFGIAQAPADLLPGGGRQTPLPVHSAYLVGMDNPESNLYYREPLPSLTYNILYGPSSGEENGPALLEGLYKIYIASTPQELGMLPRTIDWQQKVHSGRHYSSALGKESWTLKPIGPIERVKDVVAGHWVFAQAYGLEPLVRTNNRMPPLAALGPDASDTEKYHQHMAIKAHFDLEKKYGDKLFYLSWQDRDEELDVLSGGRGGTSAGVMKVRIGNSLHPDLMKELEQRYGGDPDFESIKKDGLSLVYRIATGPRQQAMLEHRIAIQKILMDAGFPVPKLDEAGLLPYYREDTGQSICLEEYVPGRHTDKLGSKSLSELGKALGKLHGSALKFPEPPVANVLDENKLIEEARWGLTNMQHLTRKEWDRTNSMPTEPEMRASLVKELIARFKHNDENVPAYQYIARIAPDLAVELDINARSEAAWKAAYEKEKEEYRSLPRVSSCWNDGHRDNIMVHESGAITMIDFENSGPGMPVRDLELALFYECVDDKGNLDRTSALPLLMSYVSQREKAAREKNGPIPMTREEVTALPKLLAEASRGRELAIAVMFRDNLEEYKQFCKRIEGLRRQMSRYMDQDGNVTEKGARRFADEFLGRELEEFPPLAEIRPQRNFVDTLPKERQRDWRAAMTNNAAGIRGDWQSRTVVRHDKDPISPGKLL